MERTAGIILIVGSILFLVAAFMPISWVYAMKTAKEKMERIEKSPGAWRISQLFFALGATVTAIGFGLVAVHFRTSPGALAAYLGVVVIVLGAVLWDWDVYLRAINPEQFVQGLIPGWLFVSYTVLTQFGLVTFGVAFLQAGLPRWLGLGTSGAGLVLFIATLIFKDMPPFVYYLLTLIAGIVLVR